MSTETEPTAQQNRDAAAILIARSVAQDRKAAADRAASADPMRQFAAKLFAAVEDE